MSTANGSERSFALNPGLIAYAADVDGRRRVAIEVHSGTPPLVVDDARLPWALESLPSEFTRLDALAAWTSGTGDAGVAAALWDFCRDSDLIVHAEAPRPGAGYHAATRSYPFLDMASQDSFQADNEVMREYTARDPYPPVYLDLPRASRHELRKADDLLDACPGGALPADALEPLDVLALILDGVFGERRSLAPSDAGPYLQLELIFKSVPSGGARHPTECLAFVRNGTVPDGLYHYNVRANALDRLARQPAGAEIAEGLGAEVAPGETVFMLASHVERAMWRYREPRSYRAVVIDAGHADEQLSRFCAAAGLRYQRVRTYESARLARLAGLDPERFPILACSRAAG